jgi:DNA polymerase-3 subunit delta'
MLIGHEKQKKSFAKAAESGSLSHAYILSGPEGIGKKQFAFELFKLINKREPQDDPDFCLIRPKTEDDETKIYIEDIRNLKNFLSLKPYFGPFRMIAIDDADRLTADAANALLKTLEEPSISTILILITANPKTLLPTVRSRCEEIKFTPQSRKEIEGYLANKKIPAEDKELLLSVCGGRIGWIIKMLDDDKIKDLKAGINEFKKILERGVFEKMQYAKKVYEKEDYRVLFDNILSWAYSKGIKNPKAMRELLKLRELLSQPQYNHRLAIENFLINL